MGGGSAWAINEREIIKINRDNFATSSPDPLFSPKVTYSNTVGNWSSFKVKTYGEVATSQS